MFTIGTENQLAYWITMLLGGVAALVLGWARCEKAKVRRARVALATVLLPLFTVFFSHLLYCLADTDTLLYSDSYGYLFAFWQPGGMVYGGILGAVIGLMLIGGRERLEMMEQYAPSGALMIAAARVGEGFLGQGYGEYVTEATGFARFPFMVYDPYNELWGWALFVLEALVALVLLGYLLRRKKTWAGDGALLMLGLYACCQIVLESLRRDEYLRWGFVRVEEVISAVVVLAVLVCYSIRAGKAKRLRSAVGMGAYALLIVFCLLLEFATEGRIPFLAFLDVSACYIAMAGACALLCATVLYMHRLALRPDPHEGKERRNR